MTLTAVLKYRNADSTRDMNSRILALFQRGVLTGGTIVPVSGSLEVDVQPFTAQSEDGMLVTSDDAERVAIPLDQTSVISLYAQYSSTGDPTLEVRVTEASLFSGLLDRDFYVVLGAVTISSPATEVTTTDISYALRERQDRRGNLIIRGVLQNTASLPVDPNFNFPGDSYIVTPGGGVTPDIYSWDGLAWINITATAAIASDLAQHRANLFPNEIHLTDDQADAVSGSSGVPSASNRFVTEADTRLPTQDENDALEGSDATPPSGSNRYIVESEPLAAPSILSFPVAPGGFIQIPVASGPTYVGNGVVGSADQYFSFLNFTLQRGYTNSSGIAPNISGIFKDIFLTSVLNPSVDADSDGFFTGDIFISLDNVIDTSARLVYGKKASLGSIDKGFSVAINPADNTIPAKVVELLSNIKGRPFDDSVPVDEQNINLKLALDGLSTYIGSVLETNVVAANEDFVRMDNDPILGDFFTRNIGIPDIYTFENTGLVSFGYVAPAGLVQYTSPVNLSGVRVGDFFTDGAGLTFEVSAVNDGSNNLSIVSRETGEIPTSITASVGTSVDGSTKVNNNPRDLLLSEMKFSNSVETIRVKEIVRKTDEFSLPDGQISYGVVTSENRFEPRLVFFGGWENFKTNTGETFVRNNTGNGSFMVTGFFTDVSLIMRRRQFSPALDISIDKVSPATTISTSALNLINDNVGSDIGAKLHRVPLANGLPSGRPNTVQASITAATLNPLDIYGFEIIRSDSESLAFLESGRAFDQARIVQRDTLDPAVPVTQLTALGRGGRLVYSVADASYNNAIFTMQNLDQDGTPSGSIGYSGNGFSTSTEVTITAGVGKLVNYRVGDIIRINDGSTIEARRVTSKSSTVLFLDAAVSFPPTTAVTIRHVCGTDSNVSLSTEESFAARYVIADEFINGTPRDFSATDTRDRFVLHCDGQTIVAGENITVTSDDLSGASVAIQGSVTDSSVIKFRVTATRLDILAVNGTAGTANVVIDGSTAVPFSWSVGAQRKTLFYNARYETHEVTITPTAGNISISEISLFQPFKPTTAGFPSEVADLPRIARYEESQSTLTTNPNVFPTGAVFYEQSYLSYINGSGTGTDWVVSDDFTKSDYGRYIASDRESSFIEFYFLGTCFELQYLTGPDHGTFKVQVDGIELESTGGTVVGSYTGNEVDAYTAVYGRRNIGAFGLSYGYHKVTAGVKASRTQNGSSTGFLIAFAGYYVGNENGYMTLGLNREGFYTNTPDIRTFIPLEIDSNETALVENAARAAKVPLTFDTTSIAVVFSEPYPDTNFVVTATLLNTTDPDPTFQPLVVTAQSNTGFSLEWNSPLPTGNYVLMYQTNSFQ